MSSFNWPVYLRWIGKAILVIGIIVSIVLAFTIVNPNVPGYHYIKEFSPSGLAITLITLFGSVIMHAIICWLAQILSVTEAIYKKLIKPIKVLMVEESTEVKDPK